MTALAADRTFTSMDPNLVSLPVAANATIYAGALVCINTDGYAVAAANTSGYIFAGVALQQVVNGAVAGAKSVQVQTRGIINAVAAGLDQANVGAELYITDDQTVQTTAAHVRCGRLAFFDSATKAWVDLNPTEDKDAGSQYFCINAHWPGAVGHVAVTALQDFELPRAYKVISGFAKAGTAPGSGYNCLIRLSDATTNFDITIAGTATAGENKVVSANMKAAFDTDVTLIDDDASGATAEVNVLYVCQYV